jgi:hypothetical protein
MRHRRVRATAFLALAGALAMVAGGAQAQEERTPSQSAFFRDLLLKDRRTAAGISKLLRTNAGFVAPRVIFADLTGDGRADALVRVMAPGASGAVGFYLFSSHGQEPDARGRTTLRAVYRNQTLYRLALIVSGATVIARVPSYSQGDDLCCPARILERQYVWSERARSLRLRTTRRYDGPGRG